MRCPQCQERNSVAARKCNFCGERFKAKPLPKTAKLAVSGTLLIGCAAVAAAIVMPCMTDPGQSLKNSAKRMAAGPKSVEDAHAIKEDFTQTIKNYLITTGHLPAHELTKKLQEILPSNSYEVHVSELNRGGLKLVEVDAILQAHSFLVMKGTNSTKVFPLNGLEVFDDSRILSDSAGPMLALLGHTGGQPPHRPQLRVLALLPDNILDETEKLVPPIVGDGSAKFANGLQNIEMNLSMASMFKGLNTSFPVVERDDHNVKLHLVWKDARYQLVADGNKTPALALYQLMRNARKPEAVSTNGGSLGASGVAFVKQGRLPVGQPVAIAKLPPAGDVFKYKLSSSGNGYAVSVQHKGDYWNIIGISPLTEKEKQEAGVAEVAIKPAPEQHLATAAEQPAVAASLTHTLAPAVVATAPAIKPAPVVVAQPKVTTRQAGSWVVSHSGGEGGATVTTTSRVSSAATTSGVGTSHASSSSKPSKPNASTKITTATAASSSSSSSSAASATSHVRGRQAQIATNINVDSVRLRRSPTVNSTALAEIVTGSNIEIIGKDSDWYKVRWNGQEGYVFAPLVDDGSGSTASASPAATHVANASSSSHNGSGRSSSRGEHRRRSRHSGGTQIASRSGGESHSRRSSGSAGRKIRIASRLSESSSNDGPPQLVP